MNRSSFVAATAMIAVSASATPLVAQSFPGRSIQFGLTGGFTKPVGDVSSTSTHGGNAGALVTIGTPESRLRFRLDGQWQQITGKVFGGGLLCIGCVSSSYQRNYRVFDATANAVYSGALSSSVRLYTLAGIGVYDVHGTNLIHQDALFVTQNSRATRLGFNGGAGVSLRMGHVATFVEARFHQLLGSHTYENDGFNGELPGAFQLVPISVGIVF